MDPEPTAPQAMMESAPLPGSVIQIRDSRGTVRTVRVGAYGDLIPVVKLNKKQRIAARKAQKSGDNAGGEEV